jgi:hypothetical protein
VGVKELRNQGRLAIPGRCRNESDPAVETPMKRVDQMGALDDIHRRFRRSELAADQEPRPTTRI